jgi:hypothetical protein
VFVASPTCAQATGELTEQFVDWMPLGSVVTISCGETQRIVDDGDIVMFGGPIDSTVQRKAPSLNALPGQQHSDHQTAVFRHARCYSASRQRTGNSRHHSAAAPTRNKLLVHQPLPY